jgi:acyl-CoA thioesterase-1
MFKLFIKNLFITCFVFLLAACGGEGTSSETTITLTKPKKPVVILVYGDSISQGYGISAGGYYYQQITPGNTYAELLKLRINNEKLDEFASVTVVNESLGGEFTQEAVSRLPSVLAYYRPTHVVLAHGTNDAASDIPFSTISDNFITMINMSKGSGAKVLLADVTFSKYGVDFANRYSKMVSDTAYLMAATYVPLLKDVLGNAKYYLADGFHPNDAAQNFLTNNLWEKLIPLIN